MILQAARLTRWKGQGVLIDAAGQLQQARGSARRGRILAGDAQGRDGYVSELQAQIERLGLTEHVRLVGHVEDIAAAYRAAHVTVVASIEPEAFGRTAIEAAGAGLPGHRHEHRRAARNRHGSTGCCATGNNRMAGAAGRRRGAGACACRGARPGARGALRNGGKGPPARARQFHHRGHAAPDAGGLRQTAGDGAWGRFKAASAGKRSRRETARQP